MLQLFLQEFYTQQGKWIDIFENPLPLSILEAELEEKNKTFTVLDVKNWVEKNNSMDGRFQFFESYAANSEFYLKVDKPLLSMRTVGSMVVERRIKPIKHTIMTKKRNRLFDPKGVVLYRASENLKHIMMAKKILGKKITDSL